MDIGSLSDQELLNFIILLGLGAVVFAGIFIVGLVFYVRGKRAANKRASANTPKRALSSLAGGSEDTMGSLLKSRMKKSQKSLSDAGASADTLTPMQSSPVEVEPYRELLRVLVNASGEKIIVEVDGKQYETIGQVEDRSIGQRILETAAALLGFTGGYIASVGGVKNLSVPDVKLTALPPQLEPVPATIASKPFFAKPEQQVASAAERFLADMEAKTQDLRGGQEPVEKRSFWEGGAFNRKGKSEAPAQVPSFNLAEEIDEIVQQKLQQANEQTRVKIHAGAGGMVRIQVADKFYDSVDQVEDKGIQTIIKNAIEEWNK